MVYLKTVLEIEVGFKFLIRSGKLMVMEDMQKYPAFDPNRPPKEKNYYFDRANENIGRPLLRNGLIEFSERYYSEMLKTILNFEKQTGKNFNKGMVYANLGVSQMALDNFDQGIANLLKAHEEDKAFHGSNYEKPLFQGPLYSQFEKNIIEYLINNGQLFATQASVIVDETFITELLNSLSFDNRLLFTSTIRSISQNINILKENNNTFTRGRLFSDIKNLCLFVEDVMKRKAKSTGMSVTKNTTLKDFIEYLVDHQVKAILNDKTTDPSTTDWRKLTTAGNIGDFDANLQQIYKFSGTVESFFAKCFLYLGAARNFSGHNFETSESYFFENFQDILRHILGTVLYLRHHGKL